ncbi:hypothetical protein D1872_314290 [compost metagenome]
MVEDVGLRFHDGPQRILVPEEVGNQYFHRAKREPLADRRDRPREDHGASVLQIVARHTRYDAVS